MLLVQNPIGRMLFLIWIIFLSRLYIDTIRIIFLNYTGPIILQYMKLNNILKPSWKFIFILIFQWSHIPSQFPLTTNLWLCVLILSTKSNLIVPHVILKCFFKIQAMSCRTTSIWASTEYKLVFDERSSYLMSGPIGVLQKLSIRNTSWNLTLFFWPGQSSSLPNCVLNITINL